MGETITLRLCEGSFAEYRRVLAQLPSVSEKEAKHAAERLARNLEAAQRQAAVKARQLVKPRRKRPLSRLLVTLALEA